MDPVLDAAALAEHLYDADWVVFDCRHDLMNPEAGPAAYAANHIPGAFHAHIDRDLSSPVRDGSRGRHPLPEPGPFCTFLERHGVHGPATRQGTGTTVVAYDEGPGMWAARLWWLLRHYGHERVALLDGGLAAWTDAGLPLSSDPEPAPGGGAFTGRAGHMPTVDAEGVATAASDGRVFDARAAERYRGDVEPIDPVGGHIPGALSLPFGGNVDGAGRMMPQDALRRRYAVTDSPVMYCGSGVTASHNVLAAMHAGLPAPALYPGSWSEWCQPAAGRPVATGPHP